MAGEKFSKHIGNGVLSEVVATQTGGAGNENLIPSLDATGRLDSTMMPVGVGADTASIATSETLAAGDIVNVWDNTGAAVRKASAADNTKNGMGFVLAGATHPTSATVYFEGQITGLSGLTPGAKYFLDPTTPGLITATAPTGSGQVVQVIGRAISTTVLAFEPSEPIVLA